MSRLLPTAARAVVLLMLASIAWTPTLYAEPADKDRGKAKQAKQAPGKEPRKEVAAARKQAREARKEARLARKQGRKAARQKLEKGDQEGARAAMREAHEKARQALKKGRTAALAAYKTRKRERGAPDEEQLAARLERRKQARRAAWARLHARFKRRAVHKPGRGPSSVPPPVRAELRVHAKRMAWLSRITVVARQKQDDEALARIEKLQKAENARHDEHIAKLLAPRTAEAAAKPAEEAVKGKEHKNGEEEEAAKGGAP